VQTFCGRLRHNLPTTSPCHLPTQDPVNAHGQVVAKHQMSPCAVNAFCPLLPRCSPVPCERLHSLCLLPADTGAPTKRNGHQVAVSHPGRAAVRCCRRSLKTAGTVSRRLDSSASDIQPSCQ